MHQDELRLFGGLFLCGLGVKTFFSKPYAPSARMQGVGLAQAYATTVALTLTNPATLLSFVAVFAGAGLGQKAAGTLQALAMVIGVFAGSAGWWLLLTGFVARWRERYPDFAALAPNAVGGAVVAGVTLGVAGRMLRRINRISGGLLLAFGLLSLGGVLAQRGPELFLRP